jgi:hypothetical protein
MGFSASMMNYRVAPHEMHFDTVGPLRVPQYLHLTVTSCAGSLVSTTIIAAPHFRQYREPEGLPIPHMGQSIPPSLSRASLLLTSVRSVSHCPHNWSVLEFLLLHLGQVTTVPNGRSA